MGCALAIKCAVVSFGSWAPLVIPMNCSSVQIVNQSGVDVLMRTDPDDDTTEFLLSNGESFSAMVPWMKVDNVTGPRFWQGQNMAWFQLQNESDPVKVHGFFVV